MDISVSTVEYTKTEEGPIIHIFGRDKNLYSCHIMIYDIFPFFYVLADTPIPKNSRIKSIEKGLMDLSNRPVKKITMFLPEDIGGNRQDKDGFRNRFQQTYEDDILFTIRAMVELGIKSGVRVNDYISRYGTDSIIPIDLKLPLRRCHLDIETSERESAGMFPSYKNPVNHIFVLTCFDTYDNVLESFMYLFDTTADYIQQYKVPINNFTVKQYPDRIRLFPTEKEMLQAWIEYIDEKNPDIITGWNAKKFDMPYLIARAKKLSLNVNRLSPLWSVYIDEYGFAKIKGRIVFDTWSGYQKLLLAKEESTKLDFVSKKLFGIGKVERDRIDVEYSQRPAKLLLYNIQDTFLDYAIGENQKIFQFFYDVHCFTGCMYEDVLENSKIIDFYLLCKAKEAGLVLPSKRHIETLESSYQGAVVIQAPKPGIQYWIAVLDLKSLYPMCMLTCNMGEDTLVLNPTPEQITSMDLIHTPLKGVYFKQDRPSFLSGILSELVEYRDSLKVEQKKAEKEGRSEEADLLNRIQTVIKFITNSLYGVLGYQGFRLYNKHIAACVTATARFVILATIEMAKKAGFIVYYGDTDSIFINAGLTSNKEICMKMAEFVKFLNKCYVEVLGKQLKTKKVYLEMKHEKIYRTFFMIKAKGTDKVAKKRYAGRLVWNDKKGDMDEPDITGFDRSDMSRVGNTIIKQVLEMAVYERVAEIIPYLKDEVTKIKTGFYPLADIATAKGISKPLELYGNQDWIRAARWTNEFSHLWDAQTNYGSGSKPKFIYMDPMKIPGQFSRIEIIALDENDSLPSHLIAAIDWKITIEKTIGEKVSQILDALGLRWETVISKQKVNRLGGK